MSGSTESIKLALIASFNLQNLAAMLSNNDESPRITTKLAPFGHVTQTLLTHGLEVWNGGISSALVWTSPEMVSSSFCRLVEHEKVDQKEILNEVDEFCHALRQVPSNVRHVFIPSWTLSAEKWRLGLLDMHTAHGVSLAVARMNLRLSENLGEDSRMFVLDTWRWLALCGDAAFSRRLWYMAKIPYSNELFKVAVREIKAAIRAVTGQARKLLILDLDDTLWGGTVGDLGWQKVRLGGHDAIGEAYKDFQIALKRLKKRGVLLGIVSKNEENTALEATCKHPEMVLRPSDFCGWRINWDDKAQNVVNLVSELNLGLQSVVFIDDNPVERARVRDSLPEVHVPDWPQSPMDYERALSRLTCFDTPHISEEDRKRTEMYISERDRSETRRGVSSVDEWLNTLQMRVEVEELTEANVERITQLINKTNQMNLATRRLTRDELWSWAADTNNRIFAYRVADRFGDYGLVGLGSFRLRNDGSELADVVDFVLSCRVMGRGVEEVMLHTLATACRANGASRLIARYVPSSKNAPCLSFLERSGFRKQDSCLDFVWETCYEYAYPKSIDIKYAAP